MGVLPEPECKESYLTSFPVYGPTLASSEFEAIWAHHGAAMFRLPWSPTLLEQSFSLVDPLLATQDFIRFPSSEVDNVSSNPTNDTSLTSPKRWFYKAYNVLAPADDTVQGPHQEGAHATRGNRRAVVFLCQHPAERGGGTALFDMQRAWELLPLDLQQLLAKASFSFPASNTSDGRYVVPAVVLHDVTGAACLQFYCFGRARHACVDVYRARTGHYDVRPDDYHYTIHPDLDLELIHANGTRQPFIGLKLYRMLDAIYDTMIVHVWSRGEALVVDNIRWAHARLEGSGPDRKIDFYHYGYRVKTRPWTLNNFARPSL